MMRGSDWRWGGWRDFQKKESWIERNVDNADVTHLQGIWKNERRNRRATMPTNAKCREKKGVAALHLTSIEPSVSLFNLLKPSYRVTSLCYISSPGNENSTVAGGIDFKPLSCCWMEHASEDQWHISFLAIFISKRFTTHAKSKRSEMSESRAFQTLKGESKIEMKRDLTNNAIQHMQPVDEYGSIILLCRIRGCTDARSWCTSTERDHLDFLAKWVVADVGTCTSNEWNWAGVCASLCWLNSDRVVTLWIGA